MEIDVNSPIYFTRSNLRIALGANRRTLDYKIASLKKKGTLVRLKKGIYLNMIRYNQSPDQRELLLYIGQIMVFPSYLSGEYVLSEKGFLSESVFQPTYITTKKTQRFVSPLGRFIYRNIKEDLFFGFETKKVDGCTYYRASDAKALFDMLYLTFVKSTTDITEFLTNSRFNWEAFDKKDINEFEKMVRKTKIAKNGKSIRIFENERSDFMIDKSLSDILKKSDYKTPSYARNVAKEEIQNYVLNFVYQHKVYQNLIFTGGTCLRKLYGLDRLSEDLDFDYTSNFKIEKFQNEIKSYFESRLGYKTAEYKITNNKKTLFIKFPMHDLFVQCDFSPSKSKIFGINQGLVVAGQFNFLVNAYDLETMFANKIVAFLSRNFYKGKFQKIPFKGRDVYDLFWFLQLSARNGYKLRPNKKRLVALTGVSLDKLKSDIKKKIKKVDPAFVVGDVEPLVETNEYLKQMSKAFEKNITNQINMVM